MIILNNIETGLSIAYAGWIQTVKVFGRGDHVPHTSLAAKPVVFIWRLVVVVVVMTEMDNLFITIYLGHRDFSKILQYLMVA